MQNSAHSNLIQSQLGQSSYDPNSKVRAPTPQRVQSTYQIPNEVADNYARLKNGLEQERLENQNVRNLSNV